MWKYVIKRLILMIPILLAAILIVFFVMSFATGDAALMRAGDGATEEQLEAIREEMGLNDPLLVQYVRYVFNLFRGDFGTSYRSNASVISELIPRIASTMKLSAVAFVICVVLSVPLGIIAAVKQNSIFDTFSMVICLLGLSVPSFWLALLLIMLFGLSLGWLPVSGSDGFASIIMPAFTQAVSGMAMIARVTRSSMLETVRQDYMLTARAKGLNYFTAVRKHALPNAMLPLITVVGIELCALLAGAVVTETVFAWPGIGRFLVQSISWRDTPSVLGCVIFFCVCFTLINLLVDIAYGFVDPRIKAQYKK